jgi:hypothetical protein
MGNSIRQLKLERVIPKFGHFEMETRKLRFDATIQYRVRPMEGEAGKARMGQNNQKSGMVGHNVA